MPSRIRRRSAMNYQRKGRSRRAWPRFLFLALLLLCCGAALRLFFHGLPAQEDTQEINQAAPSIGLQELPAKAPAPAFQPLEEITARPAAPALPPVPATIAESVIEGPWIFIDKGNFRLYLADGPAVRASWPIALGKNSGDKQAIGDMRTPEGTFSISQIQNSRAWTHDFGDGKGVIQGAYGPWFLRIRCGWQGIGIHGTHDPDSIGTLVSEGCIRMINSDLEELKRQTFVGMPVIIAP